MRTNRKKYNCDVCNMLVFNIKSHKTKNNECKLMAVSKNI